MSNIKDRRDKIIKLLEENDSMTVQNIIDNFDYSPATIRNDLKSLNNEGIINRKHGLAEINQGSLKTYTENFSDREMKFHEQKQELAQESMKYIKDSQCIILDASSTCYELAKLINKSDLKLTIITNGLMVANLLKGNPSITLILIGGIVNGASSALEGLLGIEILSKINIDCSFVSPNAFTVEKGLTDFSIYEVQLKKEMVKHSDKTIALLSQEKLGSTSLAQFATTDQIDRFIISKATECDDETISNFLENSQGLDVVFV